MKGYWESLALWGPYGGMYLALYGKIVITHCSQTLTTLLDSFKTARLNQKRAPLSTTDVLRK